LNEAVAHSKDILCGINVQAVDFSKSIGKYHCTRMELNGSVLSHLPQRLTLSCRISAEVIASGWDQALSDYLEKEITKTLVMAKRNGLTSDEIQCDCDCPTRLLDGYAKFLQRLKTGNPSVKWTFTALPSWLHDTAFKRLAHASDGFVLQVHWLRRLPDGRAVLLLPDEAMDSANSASTIGVPFRVALPTYGSAVLCDVEGHWVKIISEERFALPQKFHLIEAASPPLVCLDLLKHWEKDRPPWLEGIVWYRLPVHDDLRNWSWSQFATVVRGRVPKPSLTAELRPQSGGWDEVVVQNVGDGDGFAPAEIHLEAPSFLASDGTDVYHSHELLPGKLDFSTPTVPWLKAGDSLIVGWVRRGDGAMPAIHLDP
jgi:hypothetical protein